VSAGGNDIFVCAVENEAEPTSSHKCRVVIVDDNLPIRQAIRELLTSYDDIEIVAEAGDGNEAVALALSCQPDVILMDLNMPTMNGIEAARWIKSSWNDISIIGLCAVPDSYTMATFHKAGASATISKNTLHQLQAAIQGACCHKAHARAR
jgi:DNA-binding NarL/FixJ family response regulator